MESTNFIYKNQDQNKYTALISLDLSKAFDSIDHQLLLQKLLNLGISIHSINWIESYLSNRKQRTKFSEYTSSETVVTAGIPQGSILGPLLFTCFTNDMAAIFDDICKMIAYADDTQLLVTSDSTDELKIKALQAINTAQKWFTSNSMKNNVAKTDLIIFTPRTHPEDFHINTDIIDEEGEEIILKAKKHIKILGVTIDEKLNWSKQVNAVKRKSMNATRSVHRVNHFLPLTQRKLLYNTVISPNFSYCDVIFDGCNVKDAESLQRVQNFAAKSVTGNRKYDSATESLQQLNLLNLKQRREIHSAVAMHKIISTKTPANLYDEYQAQCPTSSTRYAENGNYIIPTHSTTQYKRSCLYRTIQAYNSAPNKCTTASSNTFKTNLQKHFLHQTYSQVQPLQNHSLTTFSGH